MLTPRRAAVAACGRARRPDGQQAHHLAQAAQPGHGQRTRAARLAQIGAGDDQTGEAGVLGGGRRGRGRDSQGRRSPPRPSSAKRPTRARRSRVDLLLRREHAAGEREIELGPALARRRRGQVDGHALAGKAEPAVEDGGMHALARVARGAAGEPDTENAGSPPRMSSSTWTCSAIPRWIAKLCAWTSIGPSQQATGLEPLDRLHRSHPSPSRLVFVALLHQTAVRHR